MRDYAHPSLELYHQPTDSATHPKQHIKSLVNYIYENVANELVHGGCHARRLVVDIGMPWNQIK